MSGGLASKIDHTTGGEGQAGTAVNSGIVGKSEAGAIDDRGNGCSRRDACSRHHGAHSQAGRGSHGDCGLAGSQRTNLPRWRISGKTTAGDPLELSGSCSRCHQQGAIVIDAKNTAFQMNIGGSRNGSRRIHLDNPSLKIGDASVGIGPRERGRAIAVLDKVDDQPAGGVVGDDR